MSPWSAISVRRNLLKLIVLLWLPHAASGEEPGFIFAYKDPNAVKFEVRKARKLERQGGFYVAESFAGRTERLDAFHVRGTIDLASLQPANFKAPDDLANAKASEARAEATAKKHPELASHVAPYLAQLRAEIARAERGEKKIDGRWMTAAQAAALYAHEESTVKRGVLTLKNGTSYRDVEIVSVNKQELRIMHADGAAKVPLHLVPEEFQREYLKNVPTEKK